VGPHGRWRSLPPEGAGRFVAGGARLLAPLNFEGAGERQRRAMVSFHRLLFFAVWTGSR